MKRFRPMLVMLHRYAALALGLLMLVQAVTGCAMVFGDELDALFSPHLHPPRQHKAQLPLDAIVGAALGAASPAAAPLVVRFPHHDGGAFMVLLQGEPGPGTEPGLRQVFVDAYSGAVLGQRGTQDTLLQMAKRLHADLYLGEIGVIALLVTAAALFLLALSGPFLWQPKGWQVAGWFSVKWSSNPVRRYVDLHKVSGFWLAPLYLVTALTSVYMLDPPLTAAAVKTVLPLKAWRMPAPEVQAGSLPLAQLVAVAQARYPDAELASLRFPRAPTRPYAIELVGPGDVTDGHSGSIKLAIDPASAAILVESTPAQYSAGDRLMEWQYPLHNGHAFGLPGRILVFIGGLCIALLFLTGGYVWFKKKVASLGARRRKRERLHPLQGSAK